MFKYTTKKAECTICGKTVTKASDMLDHYKEHPEVRVISGVIEADVLEKLLEDETKQENALGKKGISVVVFNADGTVFSNDSISEVAEMMNEQRVSDGLEPLTEEGELQELIEWTEINIKTAFKQKKGDK